MAPEIYITIIGGVLALAGSGGLWQYKQSRKEAPVKKQQADLVVAETSSQIALSVAESLRTDVAQLRTDLRTERDERQKLDGRMEGLETRLREQDGTIRQLRDMVQAFSFAWDDLTARWQTLRHDEAPPPRPAARIH